MIVPAKHHEEAFEICQNFPRTDLMAFGYFEGNSFDDLTLLCKTSECYEKFEDKKNTDKLIMKISYHSEQLILSLSVLGPEHLSLSTEDGHEECEKVFDSNFYEHKDEISKETSPKRKTKEAKI